MAGPKCKVHHSDFKSTHHPRAILPHLGPLQGRRILEPSAGTGGILVELMHAGATHVTAVERDEERERQLCRRALAAERPACEVTTVHGNFLLCSAEGLGGGFDLVVMNPPFSTAQEHVEHAFLLLASGGIVAALLRLAFCVSAKRAPFREAHPFDLHPLASRPSFTPDGKTDSADYAWFVFHAGVTMAREGRLCVLEGRG